MQDIVSGAIALTFGIGVAILSWLLEVGHPSQPSPGFFPFLAALGIAVLGVVLISTGLRQYRAGRPAEPWAWNWRAVGCVASLFVYTHVLGVLGFAVATFALMTGLFRLAGAKSWVTAALLGVGSAAISELVFRVLLKMTLPAGPWGA